MKNNVKLPQPLEKTYFLFQGIRPILGGFSINLLAEALFRHSREQYVILSSL